MFCGWIVTCHMGRGGFEETFALDIISIKVQWRYRVASEKLVVREAALINPNYLRVTCIVFQIIRGLGSPFCVPWVVNCDPLMKLNKGEAQKGDQNIDDDMSCYICYARTFSSATNNKSANKTFRDILDLQSLFIVSFIFACKTSDQDTLILFIF